MGVGLGGRDTGSGGPVRELVLRQPTVSRVKCWGAGGAVGDFKPDEEESEGRLGQ